MPDAFWLTDLIAPGSGGRALALALLGGLAGGGAGLAVLLRARRAAPSARPSEREQTAGLDFALEDGRLTAASPAGRRLLGGEHRDAADFLARMTALEGPEDLSGALRELEFDGRAFRLLAEDEFGRAWEVSGAPEAGQARLRFASAGPATRQIARLRARLAAAEAERDAAKEALEAAPLLAWRRASDGTLAWVNRAYRELAGAGEDAGSADLPPLRAEATASSGSEDAEGRRAVFDARTGERRWFEFRRAPARDGGTLGFGVDAAAAVHAEAALRRFVETLTETFAHLRIGLAIFDRESRLGLFNPAFAELVRLDPAWLAGRPTLPEVLDRLRENRRMPDPEDFSAWKRDLLDLFGEREGPRPERTEVWHLPGEEQIRVLARPHPQGAVAFLFEDVSETARLERQWLTETEMRRAVMDRLEEGVAAFGPGGTARFANPAFAAIWGFRPGADSDVPHLSDALARFRARSAPEAAEAWDRLSAFFEVASPRAPWAEEIELRDGRRLRARVAALPDGSVLTAFSDITDAARAEAAGRELSAALAAAEEIRGALIEQVSTRVRTPLNTIFGYGQMLLDGADGEAPGPRQAAHADGILDAAAEIQEAMSGVADLASAQEGALALASGPVNLRAALASALEPARRSARGRGVALTLETAEGVDMVAGDAARVRQLLFNLITDAVHRAPEGAEVRAGARRADGRVDIWTEEPAAGARPEAPPELGGLAHALVRRFAELHGGEVRVEVAPAANPSPAAGLEDGAPEAAGDRERPLPFAGSGAGVPRLRVICTLPAAAIEGGGRHEVA